MEILYTAEALATGDGRNGHVATADGLLDADVRVPKEMGGEGGALNPELLFASGYADDGSAPEGAVWLAKPYEQKQLSSALSRLSISWSAQRSA